MNRLAVALVAFALGMLAMDIIWLHRLAPALMEPQPTQQEMFPRPPRTAQT